MKQHINVQFAIENTLVLQKRDRRIKDAKDQRFTPAQAQDLKRKREEDNKGPKPKKPRTENNTANAPKPAPKAPQPKNNNAQNKPKNAALNKGNAPAANKPAANKPLAAPVAPRAAPPKDKVFAQLQGVLADSAVKDIAPRKQKMFEKQVS